METTRNDTAQAAHPAHLPAATDPLYAIAIARQRRALAFLRLLLGAAGFLYARLIRPIAVWYLRRGMYNRLAALDDRTLADIGIDRWEIRRIVENAYRMAAETVKEPTAAATLHRLEAAPRTRRPPGRRRRHAEAPRRLTEPADARPGAAPPAPLPRPRRRPPGPEIGVLPALAGPYPAPLTGRFLARTVRCEMDARRWFRQ